LRDLLTLRPALCARLWTPKATCRACLDVCPRAAIQIDGDLTVSSACDGCGLCAAACRNGVFDLWLRADLEARLREQGATAVVCCEAADRDAAIRVSCLGVFTEEILLEAALIGLRRIEMAHADCKSCSRRAGEALFREAIERAAVLTRGRAFEVVARRAPDRERPAQPGVSRRAMFSLFARPVLAAFAHRETPDGERRRRLIRAVQRVGPTVPTPVRGLFFEVHVSPACTGCPVCEAVCPMRAITRVEEAGTGSLRFDPLRCTGCDNCRAACPEAAITLTPRPDGTADSTNTPCSTLETVSTIRLHPCAVCGASVGGPHETCLSCRGRSQRSRLAGECV